MVNTVMTVERRSVGIAYLLWFFFGAFGAHQFYMGKPGRAVSMLLTLGWLTIGLWVDMFTIPRQVRRVNARALDEVAHAYATRHGQLPASPVARPTGDIHMTHHGWRGDI